VDGIIISVQRDCYIREVDTSVLRAAQNLGVLCDCYIRVVVHVLQYN